MRNKWLSPRRYLSLLVVPSLAAIGAVSALSVSADGEARNRYIFNGMLFNSREDLLKHLFGAQIAQVNDTSVLGEPALSFLNADTGLLNKDLLPTYDDKKISIAYAKASGELTPDYAAAKATYFNPGLVRLMYDDGYGNVFNSESEARYSQQSRLVYPQLDFLTVPFVRGLKANATLETSPTRLNPLSAGDNAAYLANLTSGENLEAILAAQLNSELAGGAAGTPQYSVKFLNSKPKAAKVDLSAAFFTATAATPSSGNLWQKTAGLNIKNTYQAASFETRLNQLVVDDWGNSVPGRYRQSKLDLKLFDLITGYAVKPWEIDWKNKPGKTSGTLSELLSALNASGELAMRDAQGIPIYGPNPKYNPDKDNRYGINTEPAQIVIGSNNAFPTAHYGPAFNSAQRQQIFDEFRHGTADTYAKPVFTENITNLTDYFYNTYDFETDFNKLMPYVNSTSFDLAALAESANPLFKNNALISRFLPNVTSAVKTNLVATALPALRAASKAVVQATPFNFNISLDELDSSAGEYVSWQYRDNNRDTGTGDDTGAFGYYKIGVNYDINHQLNLDLSKYLSVSLTDNLPSAANTLAYLLGLGTEDEAIEISYGEAKVAKAKVKFNAAGKLVVSEAAFHDNRYGQAVINTPSGQFKALFEIIEKGKGSGTYRDLFKKLDAAFRSFSKGGPNDDLMLITNFTDGIVQANGQVLPVDTTKENANYKLLLSKYFYYLTAKVYTAFKDNESVLEHLYWGVPKLRDMVSFSFIVEELKDFSGKIFSFFPSSNSTYIMSSVNFFNPRLTSGIFSKDGLATTRVELEVIRKNLVNTPISEVFIPYDINGKRIQVGNYKYDSETLMRFNAINVIEPTRRNDVIFYEGIAREVVNKTSVIKHLTINYNGTIKDLYFITHDAVIKYLSEEFVELYSVKVE